VRFAAAWQGLTSRPPRDGLFSEITARYSEPHRAYHTMRHKLDRVRQHCADCAAVEIALWFHDAVYDPGAPDNEHHSAEWLRGELTAAGAEEARTRRAGEFVLATRHVAPPRSSDEALVVDVDLSILGADEKRFAEYERDIRREYAAVPDDVFRPARAAILRRFLARPAIYSTPWFRERLEQRARQNLMIAIERLT